MIDRIARRIEDAVLTDDGQPRRPEDECGASLDDGEGYDGKCAACADRAESGEVTLAA